MYVDLESRAGNSDARRYLDIWKALPPSERRSHVPEQLCELASILPADLVSWVSRQVWNEGAAKSSQVLSFMRDKVLLKNAQFAMESPDNYKHMELFMKAASLMPTSGGRSGPSVSIFNTPVASSGSVALAGAKTDTAPVHASGLRDMDSEIVNLSKLMQDVGQAVGKCAAEQLEDPDDEDDDDDDDEDDE